MLAKIRVFVLFLRDTKLNFNWNLEVVGHLHGGPHDENFLTIFVLDLANDIESAVVIQKDALA
jgi:hypothetical protein